MASVIVVYPVYFDVEDVEDLKLDMARIADGDDAYIKEVREKLKDAAKRYHLQSGPIDAIITDCEIEELIE